MNYMWGKIKPGKHACRLKALRNVDDDFELLQGISRINDWPDNAFFKMDENFPNDLNLEDFVWNINATLVVSEKFKEIFPENELKNVEYLPVKILNHKEREVPDTFYILNSTILQKCIDLDSSEVVFNKIDPSRLSIVRKLVISESLIDLNISIFRMALYSQLPIFRTNIVKKIEEAGLKGITFGKIEDWKGR